jgi:8-oxo-dGTP diphosphatase
MGKSDQGVSNDRYKVIPRTLIFITKGNKVLLIRGAPDKRIWANQYNGIGGHVERSEDVLSSARREIMEEAGIEILSLWLCGLVMVDVREDVGIGLYIFRGEFEKGELRKSEEGELEWIDQSEINQYHLVEDLPVLLPRILKMEKGDIPFSASYSFDHNQKLQISFG